MRQHIIDTALLLIIILTASAITKNVSLAADTTTDQIASQSNAPVASHSNNVVFEYSARKVLGYVSEARVALGNENKDEALSFIDEARNELNTIRNTRDYLEMMGIHFGRVMYGEGESYYIPIADDTYAIRTYVNGPFWSSNKAIAVRDVELVNVDIAINPEKTTDHLEAAKQKLVNNNYKGADTELKNILDESVHEIVATDQPLARLQDNIYLTRILIRQENYDGARYTLKHAKAALSDYERTLTIPERRASASNLRQEIDELDSTIQHHDPTLMKKAADKVDQWWNDLKTWTRDKTS